MTITWSKVAVLGDKNGRLWNAYQMDTFAVRSKNVRGRTVCRMLESGLASRYPNLEYDADFVRHLSVVLLAQEEPVIIEDQFPREARYTPDALPS